MIEALSKDELEAVLVHELSHILNLDVRLVLCTILFSGLLASVPEMAFRLLLFLQLYQEDLGEGRYLLRALAFACVYVVRVMIVVLSIGYLSSLLFRMALSKEREFMADARAVSLTKRPEALVRALEKIKGKSQMPYMPFGMQAMLIDSPPELFGFLKTHPDLDDRLFALRQLNDKT